MPFEYFVCLTLEALLTYFSPLELAILGAVGFTFLSQVFTWLGYSLIATHRHTGKLPKEAVPPAVSVIVVVEQDFWFLEGGLLRLLEQQYTGDWEVVVVNDCGGAEMDNALELLSVAHDRLRYTTLRVDDRFKHSRKIPLLIGIKAARYEHLLFADPSAEPASPKWLSLMARGFVGGKAVIGYTGFTQTTNRWIRSARLMTSMGYLKAAVVGKPYRGIYNNIGYTKEVFFKSRGYSHLRLALGEDDLFVQKLAPYIDMSVVVSPQASMRQTAYGGLGWWWNEERYRSFAFRYYPLGVKVRLAWRMLTQVLFFASVAAGSLLWSWAYAWAYGAGIFLLREAVVWWSAQRVMRRLGERKLMVVFLLYEWFWPWREALLSVARKVKTPTGVWK